MTRDGFRLFFKRDAQYFLMARRERRVNNELVHFNATQCLGRLYVKVDEKESEKKESARIVHQILEVSAHRLQDIDYKKCPRPVPSDHPLIRYAIIVVVVRHSHHHRRR